MAEQAQWGWGDGPTTPPNDLPLGSITKDPQGRLWRISGGGLSGGNYWEQLTGKGGTLNDAISLPSNLKVDTPWYIADQPRIAANSNSTIKIGPLGGEKPKEGRTLRWPLDAINTDTDYVFFQFGRYLPPFSQDSVYKLKQKDKNNFKKVKGKEQDFSKNKTTYEMYNSSANNLDVSDSANNIMLPIPQDLSNEIQQVWQGKQFTQLGRAAVAAMGGGNFAYANDVVKNITGNFKAIQNALTTTALNSIPGVGGNIEFNDVSGSTQGIVINPNAELLYDSPEMREIGMIFKLVPRNQDEASQIDKIVKTFRAASMPRWGATGGEPLRTEAGAKENAERDIIDFGGEDNWIRVPDLCKFSFMKGDEVHPYLIQFKPCAINRVEVNYTSDGTYATYSDGMPVCTELRLNFMETKLIFADEVAMGY